MSLKARDWNSGHVSSWLSETFSVTCDSSINGDRLLSMKSGELAEALKLSDEKLSMVLEQIQNLRFHSEDRADIADSDDVPDEFICPITQDLMRNPVTCTGTKSRA